MDALLVVLLVVGAVIGFGALLVLALALIVSGLRDLFGPGGFLR
jgi:hypothetical protein